jgi:hypothetical protein
MLDDTGTGEETERGIIGNRGGGEKVGLGSSCTATRDVEGEGGQRLWRKGDTEGVATPRLRSGCIEVEWARKVTR